MENLELNGIDKGSLTKYYQVKSLDQRCFSEKPNSNKNLYADENSDGDVYIESDSLIQMDCNQGVNESVEQ